MASFASLNSPIGLWNIPLSVSEFRKTIFDALTDSKTLVVLDTNVLALPFRLHRRARQGFYRLLNKPVQDGRVVVPAWVANEYFFNAFPQSGDHRFSESLRKLVADKIPVQAEVGKILRRAISGEEQAYLAGKLGKDATKGIEALTGELERIRQLLVNVGHELDPAVIHDELLQELSSCFASLDLTEHCQQLERLAANRRANRIPPGLTDTSKADKGKRGDSAGNADGDLAIWLEILTIAAAAHAAEEKRFTRILFLTQEQKEDFLYKPKTRSREGASGEKETNAKPDILLIDPRLVSEFHARVGHREIAVVNIEHLAAGAVAVTAAGDPKKEIGDLLVELLQTQSNPEPTPEEPLDIQAHGIVVEALAEAVINEGDVPAPGVAEAIAQANGDLHIPEAAMNDEKALTEAVDDPTAKAILEKLNSHNWYAQNEGIELLTQWGGSQNLGASFIIGRAVYQAAEGNAWAARDYLLQFDYPNVTPHLQAVLAGAVYEGFFKSDGTLRDTYKMRYLRDVLAGLEKPQFRPAREFIVRAMRPHQEHFYWLPGEVRPRVSISLDAESRDEKYITNHALVNIEGYAPQDMLRDERPNDDDWLFSNSISLASLTTNVADRLLISSNDIEIRFQPEGARSDRLEATATKVFDTQPLATPRRV